MTHSVSAIHIERNSLYQTSRFIDVNNGRKANKA